jgi:hypothetical protein
MREITEITTAKYLVEAADLSGLQDFIHDEISEITDVNHGYMFQKIYIHACLKQQTAIAQWLLEDCYTQLNPMDQIAIRPCLAYGRTLLAKKKA